MASLLTTVVGGSDLSGVSRLAEFSTEYVHTVSLLSTPVLSMSLFASNPDFVS